MLSQKAKDLFGKLGCEIQPVAVKYCFARPAGAEHVDEKLSHPSFPNRSFASYTLYSSGIEQGASRKRLLNFCAACHMSSRGVVP